MLHKIKQRIVAYECGSREEGRAELLSASPLHEGIARPERLDGRTYRVVTPLSEDVLYVTINDLLFEEGEETIRRPYEIFINSRNMDHFQWIVALTRVISSIFRKGGDITFLVEELKAVFDPRGGYHKADGRYVPSLVAEIGFVLERHLIGIGIMTVEVAPSHAKPPNRSLS